MVSDAAWCVWYYDIGVDVVDVVGAQLAKSGKVVDLAFGIFGVDVGR